MKNKALITSALLAGIGAVATSSVAQPTRSAHSVRLPTLTAKHRGLAALVGNWVISGETTRDCPYGAGKFTAKEHNELMPGGQFLISRTTYSSLFKNSTQIAIIGVDPRTGAYTYSMFNNLGVSVQAKGVPRDSRRADLLRNEIAWQQMDNNMKMGSGAVVYTTELVSPSQYRFKLVSGGGLWYHGIANRGDPVINPG